MPERSPWTTSQRRDKKKQDKALQAASPEAVSRKYAVQGRLLANLHRDLNKSSIKALDDSLLTPEQRKKEERNRKIISSIEMMDKSMSYTKAFSKEVVPANAKHYDPLDVVEDYRVLENSSDIRKGSWIKEKRFTIA